MKFSELTKQNQLLIYMMNNANSSHIFTVADNGDDVIAYGITKNKSSLSSMLNALANKGLIAADGYCGWELTEYGYDVANGYLRKCDDVNLEDVHQDDSLNNPSSDSNVADATNDPIASAFENMNKAFDCMNKAFAAMNGQPKENRNDVLKKLAGIEAGLKLVNDNAIKNGADIDCLYSFLKDILSDGIRVKIGTIFTRNVALAKTVNALLDEITSLKSQLTA